jgi:hypothetical protein
MGVYYFHREAPLVDLRPAAEVSLEEPTTPETVEARLWQDPFAAVEKSLSDADRRELEQRCQDSPSGNASCNPPPLQIEKDTLVLGVVVPGASYQDDAEHRRRTRYAVVAAPSRNNFVPKDERHIGYFLWVDSTRQRPPTYLVLPIGLPQRLVFPPLFLDGQGWSDHQVQIVPYEFFEKASQPDQEANKSVLVLWLKEEALKNQPLQTLSNLTKIINKQGYSSNKFRIIGPYASDMLHEMVTEGQTLNPLACSGTKSHSSNLKEVRSYAYGASAPDERFLGQSRDSCGSLQSYFREKLDIDLQRTIATDDTHIRSQTERRSTTVCLGWTGACRSVTTNSRP